MKVEKCFSNTLKDTVAAYKVYDFGKAKTRNNFGPSQ